MNALAEYGILGAVLASTFGGGAWLVVYLLRRNRIVHDRYIEDLKTVLIETTTALDNTTRTLEHNTETIKLAISYLPKRRS